MGGSTRGWPSQEPEPPRRPEDSPTARNMPAGELFVWRLPNLSRWVGNGALAGRRARRPPPAGACAPRAARARGPPPAPGNRVSRAWRLTWSACGAPRVVTPGKPQPDPAGRKAARPSLFYDECRWCSWQLLRRTWSCWAGREGRRGAVSAAGFSWEGVCSLVMGCVMWKPWHTWAS